MYTSTSKDEVIIKMVGKIALEFPDMDLQAQLKIRGIVEEALYKYDVIPQETALVASDIEEKIQVYLKTKELEGLSSKTLKCRKYDLMKFANCLRKPLSAITTPDLRMYLSVRCQGLKPSSVNGQITVLKTFFNWLYFEGYIPTNPAAKLKPTKEPKRLKRPLTQKEVELLRVACKTDRERALIEFAYATGCRLGEIIRINKSDINWAERTLNVIGKGNKERTVCFTQQAEVYLQRYLESRTDNCEALFVTVRRPYKRIGARSIQKEIKKIASRTNINISVHPHIFRRSFATHRLNNGTPLDIVQKFLGHESPAVTQIYAQTSRENMIHEYRRGA